MAMIRMNRILKRIITIKEKNNRGGNDGSKRLKRSSSMEEILRRTTMEQQQEEQECGGSLILDIKIDPIIEQHMTLVLPTGKQGTGKTTTSSCWKTSLIYIRQKI